MMILAPNKKGSTLMGLVLAICLGTSQAAYAAPTFVDSGFENGDWTIFAVPGSGDPWPAYGSNNDAWVDQSEWSASDGWLVGWTDWVDDHYEDVFLSASGGAGDDGAFAAIHANYGARGLSQIFHDKGATTGVVPLQFDVKTFDYGSQAKYDDNSTLTLQVVGLPDPWSQYSASRLAPPFYPDETILKTVEVDVTSEFDWNTFVEDIDFGAGYEYIVVDFRGGSHSGWNYSLPVVGVDNVAFVPEPASIAMLGLTAWTLLRRRID